MTVTLSLSPATWPILPHVEFVPESCLRRRLRGFSCARCNTACHAGAITIDQSSVIIDHHTCSGCGGCVAACPGEALRLTALDLNQAVEEATTNDTLVVTCNKQPFSAANSLHFPCLAALSRELITALFLQDRATLYFNMIACADCSNLPATASFMTYLNLLRQRLADLVAVRLVVVHDPAQLPPSQSNNRRSFLADMGKNIFAIIRNRYQARQLSTSGIPGHRRTIPARLALVNRIVRFLPEEVQDAVKAVLHPQLQIGPTCTNCPRCAGICPTGALYRNKTTGGQQLVFAPECCTGCGLCVSFCKRQVLHLSYPLSC